MGLTNHDRGAGANAGHAELGFHLHQLTGSSSYEGDGTVVASPTSLGAANMFNWINTYLDSSKTGTGVYWNAVRQDTSIDTNLWSYNQGVMIAANVLRYRLTGTSLYLQQAQKHREQGAQHVWEFHRAAAGVQRDVLSGDADAVRDNLGQRAQDEHTPDHAVVR